MTETRTSQGIDPDLFRDAHTAADHVYPWQPYSIAGPGPFLPVVLLSRNVDDEDEDDDEDVEIFSSRRLAFQFQNSRAIPLSPC